MKKKTLLLTLLALAIVTSITAGTLAVYTKSVFLDKAVEIKKFVFAIAATQESVKTPIKLAPTESQDYNFTVTNSEGVTTAEVPLDYAVRIDFSQAAKMMPGLTATLSNGTDKVTDIGGIITYPYPGTMLPEPTTHNYTLKLTWAGTDDAAQSKAGAGPATTEGLKVTVAAIQHIGL